MRNTGRRAGFTLIEIMVVVVILGILAALVMPRILDRPEEARRTKAAIDIKSIETALNLYKIDNGVYPSLEQGLAALVEKPAIGGIPRAWRDGGYLPRVPKDPWGGGYVYLIPGAHGPFDLSSLGPDAAPGGEGNDADINNWELD